MTGDYAMHQRNGVGFATPLGTLPQGTVFASAATVRFGDISLIIYPRQRPEPVGSGPGQAALIEGPEFDSH